MAVRCALRDARLRDAPAALTGAPGTDVAACEAEVEGEVVGVLATSADCVACINANAGGAANAQTCAALSATCSAQCGFGEG